MRVLLDFRDGTAAVDFGDGTAIPMRRPCLREWCEWQTRHEREVTGLVDLIAGFDAEALMKAEVSVEVADLNYAMLTALLYRPPLEPIGMEHPLWMALSDRTLTTELLTFWRDYPLSPWVNAVDETEVAAEDPDRPLIRSALPGALGARAVLYKALPSLSPLQIDGLELWQIATLLGRDAASTAGGAPDGAGGADAELAVPGFDDGGRIVRSGGTETRTWRRKPGAPFLYSAAPVHLGPDGS